MSGSSWESLSAETRDAILEAQEEAERYAAEVRWENQWFEWLHAIPADCRGLRVARLAGIN